MTDPSVDGAATDTERVDYQRRTPRARPEEIRYRNPDGTLLQADAVVRGEPESLHGLAVRSVVLDGVTLLHKSVPAQQAGGTSPAVFARLDAEVRALCRLAQVYAGRYPAELPKIIGYNVDVPEPFLMLEPLRGRAATEVIRQLEPTDRVAFQQGLLRALELVERAGLVHGAVEWNSLRWDGATVQLVDFDAARFRRPEDVGVDVAAAGTVIRQVVLGPRVNADRRGDPVALQDTLAGVFDTDPTRRPPVVELLKRLHAHPATVPFTEPDTAFEAGRAEFDRVCARKRGDPVSDQMPVVAAEPTPSRGNRVVRPGRPRNTQMIVLVVVTVVVIAALIVFFGVGAVGGA